MERGRRSSARRTRAPRRILPAAGLALCAVIGLLAASQPAHAQDASLPAQVIVTVAPPNGVTPRPTGDIIVSINKQPLLTLPLIPAADPLTATTPLANAALAVLGNHVRIGYSGDNNYEASDGVVLTVPTRKSVITLVPRPRDSAAPTIDITAPADGAQYTQGEPVTARFACADPGERSLVTGCDGTVASGRPLDTTSAGTFTFTVTSRDGLGNVGSKSVTYSVQKAAPPDAPAPNASSGGSAPVAPSPPPPPTPPGVAQVAPVVIPDVLGAVEPAAPEDSAAAEERAASRGAESSRAESSSAQASQPAAPPPAATRNIREAFAPYDPRSEPEKTFGILAASFTLLTLAAASGGGLARGGGVTRSSSGGAAKSERPRFSGLSSYQGVEIRHLAAGFGAVALGDRSRTWKWPATQRIDAYAAALPAVTARHSPLLARVLADSTYLRAIFGSASLLMPLAGLALGIAAVNDTSGDAIPPALALTAAITVLGVIDAAAGFVAMTTFLLGVLAFGGLTDGDDVRLMLGLGALWAVVPVLAGATRPLRRAPVRGLVGVWERGADFLVVSLIGAWAVQRIVLALPGLAGVELPIAVHADTIALLVLGALVLRVGLETLASHLYPLRLDSTAAADLPSPGKLVLIGSGLGRTAIYAFLAYVLIGDVWQLWVSSALFALTQIIWVFPERFPNYPRLYRMLPKGLTQLTVFLFAYTIAWLLMLRWLDADSEEFFANVFVGYGLLGLLLPMPLLFGRSGEPRSIGWGKRFVGLAVLVIAVLQVRGYLLK